MQRQTAQRSPTRGFPSQITCRDIADSHSGDASSLESSTSSSRSASSSKEVATEPEEGGALKDEAVRGGGK